jgi:ABC-type branched-subunit amino acid transport system substrate-binding protein
MYLNVSFVGSAALHQALGADGEGVVITQVVPHYDSALPGVAEYRTALARSAPGIPPDFVSLEGYLVAKAFVEGLRRSGPNPSRERLVEAIENGGPIDIGIGTPLRYSKSEHQGSHQVWPTIIRGRQIVPLEW